MVNKLDFLTVFHNREILSEKLKNLLLFSYQLCLKKIFFFLRKDSKFLFSPNIMGYSR